MLLPYHLVRWLYGFCLIIDGAVVLVSAGYCNPDLSLHVWNLANFRPYSDHADEAKEVAQELKSNERQEND